MEKVINYIVLIMNSLQYIVDGVINLAFQPLIILCQIIQSISELWKGDAENTNDTEAKNTSGYPQPTHIQGFRNQAEAAELEEIKEKLNSK